MGAIANPVTPAVWGSIDSPCDPRSDVVGSLLRPPELLDARRGSSGASWPWPSSRRIEDAAVVGIRLQEEAGLEVVTDGEMRRLSFQSQLPAAVEGFADWDLDAFLWGEWHSDTVGDRTLDRPPLAVTGQLRRVRRSPPRSSSYARAGPTACSR